MPYSQKRNKFSHISFLVVIDFSKYLMQESILSQLTPAMPRQWQVNNENLNTARISKIPPIFSIQVSGITGVVTLATGHQLIGNDFVNLNCTGISVLGLSGNYNITNIVNPSGFYVNLAGRNVIDGTYASGSGNLGIFSDSYVNLEFRRATVYGQKSPRVMNAGDVFIGASPVAGTQPTRIVSSGETELKPGDGSKYNLKDWFVQTSVSGDGLIFVLS